MAVALPIKELILDFNINEVEAAILKIPNLLKCELKHNKTLNKIDIIISSFLSFGNKISIHLIEIDDKTKISIEITRVFGSFNQWYKVLNANSDYDNVLSALGKLLENPDFNFDTDDVDDGPEIVPTNPGSISQKYITYLILIIGTILTIFMVLKF